MVPVVAGGDWGGDVKISGVGEVGEILDSEEVGTSSASSEMLST